MTEYDAGGVLTLICKGRAIILLCWEITRYLELNIGLTSDQPLEVSHSSSFSTKKHKKNDGPFFPGLIKVVRKSLKAPFAKFHDKCLFFKKKIQGKR